MEGELLSGGKKRERNNADMLSLFFLRPLPSPPIISIRVATVI